MSAKHLLTCTAMMALSCAHVRDAQPLLCRVVAAHARSAATEVLEHDVWVLPDVRGLGPVEAESALRAWASDRGVQIRVKPAWLGEFAEFASTPPVFGAFLPKDFDDRPPSRRASLLWHELGHDAVHQRLGGLVSAQRYLGSAGNRIGVEWPLFFTQWHLRAAWEGTPGLWEDRGAPSVRRALERRYVIRHVVSSRCLEAVTADLDALARDRLGPWLDDVAGAVGVSTVWTDG